MKGGLFIDFFSDIVKIIFMFSDNQQQPPRTRVPPRLRALRFARGRTVIGKSRRSRRRDKEVRDAEEGGSFSLREMSADL
jgi:hypothetical protein